MSARKSACGLIHKARPYRSNRLGGELPELSGCLSRFSLAGPVPFVPRRTAVVSLTKRPGAAPTTSSSSPQQKASSPSTGEYSLANPSALRRAPKRPTDVAARAKAKQDAQNQALQAQQQKLGGLADNSLFADDEAVKKDAQQEGLAPQSEKERSKDTSLAARNTSNMAMALNPNPAARARWQRRMVIREIQRGGELTKEMKIARSERSHLSRSHFFKTSVKKLMFLARQIAGKSIDDALLQMRFSDKKAARDVRKHLEQARDEAIVTRGMGLPPSTEGESANNALAVVSDPAVSPYQSVSPKANSEKPDTDIYIAQAWVNRGPYGQEPDYRARGQMYIMRPPHTGLSVLLKEEKTRKREKAEKEVKAIRRRMGKSMWTQLPDRPVTRQSQYLLW